MDASDGGRIILVGTVCKFSGCRSTEVVRLKGSLEMELGKYCERDCLEATKSWDSGGKWVGCWPRAGASLVSFCLFLLVHLFF